MIPVGFGGASGSYSITNSARFNGTSDYLSKTLTTSATTSGSVWVKRSKLGAVSPIFDTKVYFTSGNALYAFGLTSTALYRDPSAWMHIFWNGTGVYVNGTLVTGSGTYTAASVTNPRLGYDGTNYFSGYLSDFAFWNGSSASLQGGATNADGVWAAKRPSAGYSFLAFGSSGALGTDTSGNGNNWTVNGSPVQTTDTPTNNYATLNPLDRYQGGGSYSNGNTAYSSVSGAAVERGRATVATSSLPFYFEFKATGYSPLNAAAVGVKKIDEEITAAIGSMTAEAGEWIWSFDAIKYNNGSSAAYGTALTLGNWYRVACNPVTGKIWVGDGSGWFASGDPASDASPMYSGLSGALSPLYFLGLTGTTTFNFGATAFAYTPPTGFKALCTANLTSTAVTTSGTFTGNANADGPFIWTNGNPATLTINGNAVTFGTHADKTAGGFKLRSSSASYNTSGSNTWTATAGKRFVYSATSINTAQGNP